MDNKKFNIICEGHDALDLALKMIWGSIPGGKATHYKVMKLKTETKYYPNHHTTRNIESPDGVDTLILLWNGDKDAIKLPFPLKLENVTDFVIGWLENEADYGKEPDHDGDNGKGWRVFNEDWGHVADYTYSIIGIQPEWAMYGK